ncbi:MAG TPA: hypothetical protein VFC51_01605 [Chloroflexota bacterium]|nr:hypothetical protein [Chloroflexota bacterium]
MARWRKTDTAVLVAILCIAGATALLWLYTIPFHKAPDEGAHFQIVRFISDHGRLPVFSPDDLWLIATPSGAVETYAAYPPLAYMVDAGVGWLTREEAMWAARYASLASYIGTVALTYWIARRLFPDSRAIAITTAMLVGFLPQLTFTAAYVNNDALAVLETAAMLGLLICAWQSGARARTLAGVGLLAGELLITKYTFYGVAAIGFGTAALLAIREGRSLGMRLFALAAATAATSGWWFVRNIALYEEVIPGQVIADAKASAGGNTLFVPIDHGVTLLTLSTQTNFWEMTLKSFVAGFGFMAIFLDAPYYWLVAGIAAVGVIGVLVALRKGRPERPRLAAAAVALAIIASTIALDMVVNVYGEYSPQGRYLFPALIPLALIVARGWFAFSDLSRLLRWVPSMGVLAFVGLNLIGLVFFEIPRHYGPTAERIMVQMDRPSNARHGGEAIEVAGWSLVEGQPAWRPFAPDLVSRYRQPTPEVKIYADGPPGVGRFLAQARNGFKRPDVADFYGRLKAIDRTGFWFMVPAGSLSPGRHALYACATAPSATAPTCGEKDLEIL